MSIFGSDEQSRIGAPPRGDTEGFEDFFGPSRSVPPAERERMRETVPMTPGGVFQASAGLGQDSSGNGASASSGGVITQSLSPQSLAPSVPVRACPSSFWPMVLGVGLGVGGMLLYRKARAEGWLEGV